MQRRPWEAAKLLHAWQQQHVNPKEDQSAKLKAMNAKRILHNLAATDTITKNTAVKPYISKDRFPWQLFRVQNGYKCAMYEMYTDGLISSRLQPRLYLAQFWK